MKTFQKAMAFLLTLIIIIGTSAFSFPILASADTTGDFEIDQFGTLTAYKGAGGAVVIPNGVKAIGYSVFSRKNVTTITIPQGVTTIQSGAFEKSELTSIVLPEGVTTIDRSAFQDCAQLSKVQIPKSVTQIGQDAFLGTAWMAQYPNDMVIVNDILLNYKNKNAVSVVLPVGLKKINTRALVGMKNMTKLSIPNTVTSIEGEALAGSSALKDLVIPDSVTLIGKEAFARCTSLTNVALSKNVSVLDYSLFSRCTSLKKIVIPEGVTQIKNYVFDGCSSLSEVVLPNSLTAMDGAFIDCFSLKSIIFPDHLNLVSTNSIYSISGYGPNKYYDFTIYGKEDSSATSYLIYARSNNYKFCVIGENLIYLPNGSLLYNGKSYGGAVTMDTRTYTMTPGNIYDIGVKLAGDAPIQTRKMASSRDGIASVRQLPNGNYRVTGLRPGTTYITYTIYSLQSGKEIAHASIKVDVTLGAKQHGVACRQTTYFNR
ncbi:leucine-rich repeat domain-containing protein [Faecalispora anaeroviscerum]|uniref:leucine-rich repeat domain-containing protein n=1 Tax=Faecalispora anaeroviscerum TaxID=2991836 RepID=UPI0024B9C9BF|nr:leucine-rich repeat domain-containing protein [Faecalispora anaeroviscerum]